MFRVDKPLRVSDEWSSKCLAERNAIDRSNVINNKPKCSTMSRLVRVLQFHFLHDAYLITLKTLFAITYSFTNSLFSVLHFASSFIRSFVHVRRKGQRIEQITQRDQ